MERGRFRSFSIGYMETDLWIGVDLEHYRTDMEDYALNITRELRTCLEVYIKNNPEYLVSLIPCRTGPNAPDIAVKMAGAAARASVGPMAAVAGAFAQEIGNALERAYGLEEIIVENGGDIYVNTKKPVTLSVYAGDCALSGNVGIEIPPRLFPAGICTSSATLGHALSFGSADAVTVICKDAALADAYATRFCNAVRSGKDISRVLHLSSYHRDIIAILIIADDELGIRGGVKLIPL